MPHPIATPEQYLAARKELLEAEKELTRQSDALARRRQALPWVPVTKQYQFDTTAGRATLADLFQGRSQLLIYHFMFGPDYTAGCPSCSAIADGFDNVAVHLNQHDVTLMAVSRAPLEKLQNYKQRMNWRFPWASSAGSEFNYDYKVAFTEDQQRTGTADYNYTPGGHAMDNAADFPTGVKQFAATSGTNAFTYCLDRPGLSTFIHQGNTIYHAYSTYARGLDALWPMYPWLDRAPLGRNETGLWWKRHDEYGEGTKADGTCCQNAGR